MNEITEHRFQVAVEAAMKKAVELGLFSEYTIISTYCHNWENLAKILKAALEKLEDD